MAGDPRDGTGFSLRRWSRRKLAAQRGAQAGEGDAVGDASQRPGTTPAPAADAPQRAPASRATPRGDGEMPAVGVPPAANAATAAAAAEPPLPPVESLTFESDFSVFMRPGIDETVRRSALRKLLRDPRFNVMDGLDVYIDDYSKPSPIEPEVVRGLMQARYIFSPPATRVTADGYVEDVPEEAPAADASTETPSGTPADAARATAIPAKDAAPAPAHAPAEAAELPEVAATTRARQE